ncbi:MAG: c-type cytochrome, partial [Halocynthiibacter sp.]
MKRRAKTLATAAAAIAIFVTGAWASEGEHETEITPEHTIIANTLRMPMMNSAAGRELFGTIGCVACHSVNGVGGEGAASLDAHDMDEGMNPFDLAAKMWMMAPYMIPAQEEALGGQIIFTGDELANIVAFLHDDAEQHEFTEDTLSPEV